MLRSLYPAGQRIENLLLAKEEAKPGESIGLKVAERVRETDKVYKKA